MVSVVDQRDCEACLYLVESYNLGVSYAHSPMVSITTYLHLLHFLSSTLSVA